MLNLDAPQEENVWKGPSAQDVGFGRFYMPKLKRKRIDCTEYMVYSNETEFKVVEAETVVLALEKSEVKEPLKIVPANKRIDDIVHKDDLEFCEPAPTQEQEAEQTAAPAEEIVAEVTEETKEDTGEKAESAEPPSEENPP